MNDEYILRFYKNNMREYYEKQIKIIDKLYKNIKLYKIINDNILHMIKFYDRMGIINTSNVIARINIEKKRTYKFKGILLILCRKICKKIPNFLYDNSLKHDIQIYYFEKLIKKIKNYIKNYYESLINIITKNNVDNFKKIKKKNKHLIQTYCLMILNKLI